jgi:hypothetical protein
MDYGLYFLINKQIQMIQYCNTNLLPEHLNIPKNNYLVHTYYTKTMYHEDLFNESQFKTVLEKLKSKCYSGNLSSEELMKHVIENTSKSISKKYSIEWFEKQKELFKTQINLKTIHLY